MKLYKQKTRRAFTLVELLVVISIIALLMSIMMPSLNRARESAIRIQCAAQQRDIGVTLNLYMQDFNWCLPDSAQPDNRWFAKVAPYYGKKRQASTNSNDSMYDYKLFSCPKVAKYSKGFAPGVYGLNWFFCDVYNGKWYGENRREDNWTRYSDINQPSTFPLLACAGANNTKDPITGVQGYGGVFMSVNWPHYTAYTDYKWTGGLLKRGEYSHYGVAPNHRGQVSYLMGDFSVSTKGIWPWSDNIGTDFHPKRNVKILAPERTY